VGNYDHNKPWHSGQTLLNSNWKQLRFANLWKKHKLSLYHKILMKHIKKSTWNRCCPRDGPREECPARVCLPREVLSWLNVPTLRKAFGTVNYFWNKTCCWIWKIFKAKHFRFLHRRNTTSKTTINNSVERRLFIVQIIITSSLTLDMKNFNIGMNEMKRIKLRIKFEMEWQSFANSRAQGLFYSTQPVPDIGQSPIIQSNV